MCEFCAGYKRFVEEAKEQNRDTRMQFNARFCFEEHSQIFVLNYCPVCGRDLRRENEDV